MLSKYMKTSWYRSIRHQFTQNIYADHYRSKNVADALSRCLTELSDGQVGLNVGAGYTSLHPSLINFDLTGGKTIHVIGQAEALPFATGVFNVVITQEVMEHVRDPFKAMREISRTLRPRGVVYCQVPFIIGYHPGPTDFWRFTREGVVELVEQADLICEETGITVGPATGFYRIFVEFAATVMSRLIPAAYLPSKAAAAFFLFPVKLLDGLLLKSPQRNRIAGGYYVIARKVADD